MSEDQEKTYNFPLRMRRIYAIMKWLQENEQLLDATDAIQLTIHVKRQKDSTDSINGTILHLVKSKEVGL